MENYMTPLKITEPELSKAISDAINTAIDRAVTEEIEAAHGRLRERIPSIIAEVGVRIQGYFDQVDGDTTLQIKIPSFIRRG